MSHVIIVDGYSTGAFYVDLLRDRGVPAVHVNSVPKSLWDLYVDEP